MHEKRRIELEWPIMNVDSEKEDCTMKLAEHSSNVQHGLLRNRARSMECIKRAEWSSHRQ